MFRLPRFLNSLNLVILISVAMTASFAVLIFFVVQTSNTSKQLINVLEDNQVVTNKMQLYGQLMEYARSRTRLTGAIIREEDVFKQDEISMQLEIFANQYARARLELLELPLFEEEVFVLESQVPLVSKILPASRKTAVLAMQGDEESRQQAQKLLDDIIYPGQGQLIDGFLELMESETQRQREKVRNGRNEGEIYANNMAWIANVTLGLGFIVSLLVIYRVYLNQKEVNNSRINLEKQVSEKTQNLQSSEERLNRSQEIAHVGTWDWDITENKIYWSDETFRMFGLAPQQFIPSYDIFRSYVHQDDRDKIDKKLQDAVNNPDIDYNVIHRIIKESGEERVVEELGKVYTNEKGESVRMIGAVHDITERMQAEKVKNEFISIVSHELRTPLTAIQGTIKLLLGNALGSLENSMRNILELADNNCNRLLFLVNDILDIQKIESGKMEFHFEEMQTGDFMDEVIQAANSYAVAHDVYLIKNQVENTTINADKMRMGQVMNNLISNAVKFSEAGNKVEISARVKNGNKKVTFAVKDYGRGIPESHRDKLFKRFTQVDSSDKREKLGTGLGLAITKNIVEEHHGKIWFESEVNVGTTFFVEMDIAS